MCKKYLLTLVTVTFFATHSVAAVAPSSAEAQNLVSSEIKQISELQFDSSLSENFKRIFGAQGGVSAADYIKKRFTEVKFEEFSNRNFIAANNQDGQLEIGNLFFRIPEVYKMAALAHEAHHSDADDSSHIFCAKPYAFSYHQQVYDIPDFPAAGSFSCDKDDKGAYSVEYTFLIAVALSCQNCSSEMRKQAFELSFDTLLRISNSEAVDELLSRSANNDPRVLKELPGYIRKSSVIYSESREIIKKALAE
jgi:hypothetical protein